MTMTATATATMTMTTAITTAALTGNEREQEGRDHRFTILVPLDGASYGEAILGTAAALARPLGARVVLLSVLTPAAAAAGVRREEARDHYLRGCAAEFAGIETRRVVDVADDPAAVIVAAARREHADLIAMATHGRTGRLRRLSGSVTARVLRAGVAPVVVLRP